MKRFEDIKAWQKARSVVGEIYKITRSGKFANDFDLQRQLRRSSISIMANIAEGFGRRSDKGFAYFLNISYASAMEVESHLYLALDLGYITEDSFSMLYSKIKEIAKMIRKLSQYLRSSDYEVGSSEINESSIDYPISG